MERAQGHFYTAVVSILVGLAVPSPAPAQNSTDLAVCLLDNSGAEEEAAMKQFLVSVLSESAKAEIELEMMQFGVMIAEMSIRECGVSISDMESAMFATATQRYGELLGLRVMENAMSRIGIQQ